MPLNTSKDRVEALRTLLKKSDLDGFLIPHDDEFMNEYLPAAHERLAWLTGFTGSAGFAIVLQETAAIFVDGRYTVQVKSQVDADVFRIESVEETPPKTWLAANAAPNATIGFDPWLHTSPSIKAIEAAGRQKDLRLLPITKNPIDSLWADRPSLGGDPLTLHPLSFTGEEATAKCDRLAAGLKSQGQDAAIISSPDHVAWLLNLRGNDINHTPVGMARALLYADGRCTLFAREQAVGESLAASLAPNVDVRTLADFTSALEELGAAGNKVSVDKSSAPFALETVLSDAGADVTLEQGVCTLPRAKKNPTEIDGARAAHLRDGVAVTRFLHWLDETAPEGGVDELKAAAALRGFREETGVLKDISFPTISATGAHAALPHYFPTSETNSTLRNGEIYLVDSGGQYLDGTTDITRTVIIGTPTDEMRARFTLVLKGHIQLALARFPPKTTGRQLDAFARHALWQSGLNFSHGTGHGVGSYLGVHEGPQSISPAERAGTVALQTGMILSNEPGYYKEGAYGIRIENLILVSPPTHIPEGDQPMHGFETLTLAPIDRRLINASSLTPDERGWMDRYHARVLAEIGPALEDQAALSWLRAACAPL